MNNTYARCTLPMQEECSICLGKFIQLNTIYLTYCKHRFHLECLQHWMKNTNTCPLCRQDIGSGKLERISFKLPGINYRHSLTRYNDLRKWGYFTNLTFQAFLEQESKDMQELEMEKTILQFPQRPKWYQTPKFFENQDGTLNKSNLS